MVGADGTVGANKNSIKIIGETTDYYAQGYFVYDSKKSGTMTVSHLRFGENPIQSPYLINKANFVACHQFVFLETQDVLKNIEKGGTFLMNTPYSQKRYGIASTKGSEHIIEKNLKFYIIDALEVAKKTGMGRRSIPSCKHVSLQFPGFTKR